MDSHTGMTCAYGYEHQHFDDENGKKTGRRKRVVLEAEKRNPQEVGSR